MCEQSPSVQLVAVAISLTGGIATFFRPSLQWQREDAFVVVYFYDEFGPFSRRPDTYIRRPVLEPTMRQGASLSAETETPYCRDLDILQPEKKAEAQLEGIPQINALQSILYIHRIVSLLCRKKQMSRNSYIQYT